MSNLHSYDCAWNENRIQNKKPLDSMGSFFTRISSIICRSGGICTARLSCGLCDKCCMLSECKLLVYRGKTLPDSLENLDRFQKCFRDLAGLTEPISRALILTGTVRLK